MSPPWEFEVTAVDDAGDHLYATTVHGAGAAHRAARAAVQLRQRGGRVTVRPPIPDDVRREVAAEMRQP